MNTIINLFDTYAGPVFALIFFSIIGYVFYWIIVIAPRRIRKLFSDLQKEGYQPIETNDIELKAAISQIAAIYPVRPRKDQEIPPWNIKTAIRRIDHQASRLIAYVSRLQKDKPGTGGDSKTSRVTILFLEKRELAIRGDVHITPKKNPGDNLWKERYKASLITNGYEQAFLECYNIYSSDSTLSPLPEDLCHALIEVCPYLCQKELFCFQGGINFRFNSEGWGISPANMIYKNPDFTMMLDVCDKISRSLHSVVG